MIHNTRIIELGFVTCACVSLKNLQHHLRNKLYVAHFELSFLTSLNHCRNLTTALLCLRLLLLTAFEIKIKRSKSNTYVSTKTEFIAKSIKKKREEIESPLFQTCFVSSAIFQVNLFKQKYRKINC